MQVGQLDRVADLLDLVGQTADLPVVDVGDLLEDQVLDLRLRDDLVHVAGAGLQQERVAGAQREAAQRLGEPHHPLLVGVPGDQGALAVLQDFLEGDDVADALEGHRVDDVERLVEHHLLAAPQLVEVDARADVDPQLAAAGEDVCGAVLVLAEEGAESGRGLSQPVHFLLEGHDLVAGLSQGGGEPFVLGGRAGQIGLELDDPLFEDSRIARRVGELAAQDGDLLLEVRELCCLVGTTSGLTGAAVVVVIVGCHGPHLLRGAGRFQTLPGTRGL